MKDAIIINDICHVIVENESDKGCNVCSLKQKCSENSEHTELCEIFYKYHHHFERRGEVYV